MTQHLIVPVTVAAGVLIFGCTLELAQASTPAQAKKATPTHTFSWDQSI